MQTKDVGNQPWRTHLKRRKHEFMLFSIVKLIKTRSWENQYSITSEKEAGAFIRINTGCLY